MRIVKWILIIFVAIVAVFGAGAYLLPREATVERHINISAAPADVFPYVNSLKATQDWSPWLERDPDVVLTYSGPDSGVGAQMAWVSDEPNVGTGSQEITVSVQDQRVESALDFGEMGTATASFLLVGGGTSTEVFCILRTDMGNSPMGRWMGVAMDYIVGPDYETGLANLKALVEGN